MSRDYARSLYSPTAAPRGGIATSAGPARPTTLTVSLDFVTTPPLEGLGADLALVKRLCADDVEAADLLDRALQGRQGERTDLFEDVS